MIAIRNLDLHKLQQIVKWTVYGLAAWHEITDDLKRYDTEPNVWL